LLNLLIVLKLKYSIIIYKQKKYISLEVSLPRRGFLDSPYPSFPLPVIPFPVLFLLSLWIKEDPEAMLLTVPPAANVFLSAWPAKRSFPILVTILEISLKSPSITPGLYTAALHLPEAEFSLVKFIQVSKVVLAKTLKLTIDEAALVVRAIFPFEASFALLLSFVELPYIGSVWLSRPSPGLNSFSMLQVINPITFVFRFTIDIDENSKSIRSIFNPVSFIDIAIRVSHATLSMSKAF
jgi:hypothetical protein